MFVIAYILMFCPPSAVWTEPEPCQDLSLSGYRFASMTECQDYVRHPPASGRFYCAEMIRFEEPEKIQK